MHRVHLTTGSLMVGLWLIFNSDINNSVFKMMMTANFTKFYATMFRKVCSYDVKFEIIDELEWQWMHIPDLYFYYVLRQQ